MTRTPRTSGSRNLRVSGPTPLPEPVLEALGEQMVSHRGEEFRRRLRRVVARLAQVFGTREGTILPFTASGTGGLEAAVLNTLAPGDSVLAVRCGHFGERFAEVAECYGAEVLPLDVAWGRAADPDDLRRALRTHGPVAAVLLTHCETSTGVLNPLAELAAVVRAESPALVLVDGVSSVGATAIDMDRLGLDVVITASQKALMAPPGLVVLAASRRALEVSERHCQRRYYFDFPKMAEAVAEGTTTYTPAMGVIYGLDAALEQMLTEGLDQVFARHRELAAACRDGLRELGFEGFADPAHASPSVTSVLLPPELSASDIRSRLEREHEVFIAQGRAHLKERVLRVGHMGNVARHHIDHLVAAVAAVAASERALS
ncbi:MAG: alanine--glyoxylate aminotransferase family protein [Acidobacteria bacterium]|nr:alanine--glyoxylate aminotransferase family protein [Acidobacteriota bacterium]